MKQLLFAMALLCCTAVSAQDYKDRTLSPEKRAQDLISRLTIEEKVALMQNNAAAVERLGVKPYEWWNEALHGVARAGRATVFPQAIGMAASFDAPLLYSVFSAVSDEGRVKNRIAREKGSRLRYQGLTFWTPNINIFRDPRWGRGQETYGEDPFLTSIMGQAVVCGLQGMPFLTPDEEWDYNTQRQIPITPNHQTTLKSHACAKHLAVHSGPEWNRHTYNAENINPRDLYETYLPAFKDLVQKAHVQEVMCAYNRYEGDPCCGSDRLLTHILRNEWGYDGLVVSDCGAIDDFYRKGHHEVTTSNVEASAMAVLSGTDLECGQSYRGLVEAVRKGLIKESDIDRSLMRLMKSRFELGEMDDSSEWDLLPDSLLDCNSHHQLSLQMARESIVLLQNKGIASLRKGEGLLPLTNEKLQALASQLGLRQDARIAVIGPNANDSVMQWGNYNGFPEHTVTLLEGMRNVFGEDRIIYDFACDRTSTDIFNSLFDKCHNTMGNGFKATYYANQDFEGSPAATAHYPTTFQLTTDGGTAFAAGVPIDDFSVVYETTFTPDHQCNVEFFLTLWGAAELRINGETVAKEERRNNGRKSFYTLNAEQGKRYDIQLRYQNRRGVSRLTFNMGEFVPSSTEQLLAKVADAAVVVFAGGIAPSLEGEEMAVDIEGFKGGDRTDIQLPRVQREMLAALHKAGKHVVFVNFSGSAIGLVPETENCDAIVQAWYPGQAGGTAIAEVLAGRYNPAGRLPVTFYRGIEQLPDFEDYSMKGRTYRYMQSKPLFCFGQGLSYSQFEYDKPVIKDNVVSVKVKNVSKTDGEEVVQLYLQRPDDRQGPLKTLRRIQRVKIAAGKSATVSFVLSNETFNWWDSDHNAVRPLKGRYNILIGGSSDDNMLKKTEYVLR